MSYSVDYSFAIEKRRDWFEFAKLNDWLDSERPALELYLHALSNGPTVLMNERFCELVDYARVTLPDELQFEREWMFDTEGWLYLQRPFKTPELSDEGTKQLIQHYKHDVLKSSDTSSSLLIQAIGWQVLSPLAIELENKRPLPQRLEQGATQFALFMSLESVGGAKGFSLWSYFILNPGDKVLDRILDFEEEMCRQQLGGEYDVDRTSSSKLHEIRWIYTAFRLMSEKLAVVKKERVNRGTRRRIERDKVPISPEIKVVALRRLEEHVARGNSEPSNVEWSCQWLVPHHWHKYWYPTEGVHRYRFVSDYVKGPKDKPFRQPIQKVYKAVR